MSGTKHDQNKTRYDLLPWEALELVAKVLDFGAKKYGEDNWRDGIESKRYFSAALRHRLAHVKGEELDPESGLPHLAHEACNVLMNLATQIQHRGEFDTMKITPPKERQTQERTALTSIKSVKKPGRNFFRIKRRDGNYDDGPDAS